MCRRVQSCPRRQFTAMQSDGHSLVDAEAMGTVASSHSLADARDIEVPRNGEFRALVIAYLICLIVGQFIKPRVGSTPFALIDLVIIGMLPILLLRIRAQLGAFLAMGVFVAPNLIFGIAYYKVGDINAKHLLMGIYGCYRFLFPFLIVFAYARRIDSRDRAFCLRMVIYGVGFHVAFGIIQAAFIPNFAVRFGPKDVDWDVQGHRLVSTLLDPNLMSSLFYAALIGFLARMASVRERTLPSAMFVMISSAVAGALTASRGGALGFAMTFLLLLIESPKLNVRRKVKWLAISGLVAAIAIGIFFSFFGAGYIERTNRFGASNWSVQERLINIAIVGEAFLRHPIFGNGFNFLPYLPNIDFVSVTGNYADGGLIFLVASVGIIGLIAIGAVLVYACRCFSFPRLLVYPAIMLVVQSTSTASMYYPLLTIFVVLLAFGLDVTPVEGDEHFPRRIHVSNLLGRTSPA